MLKKHGIGRRHEKRELGHESEADAKEKQRERYEVTEPETLSSVRYELVKMQQELIRRKVLDPHHYAALSVDTLIPLREKETQNQNINVRFSDRGFMEGKAAAGPAKVLINPCITHLVITLPNNTTFNAPLNHTSHTLLKHS